MHFFIPTASCLGSEKTAVYLSRHQAGPVLRCSQMTSSSLDWNFLA